MFLVPAGLLGFALSATGVFLGLLDFLPEGVLDDLPGLLGIFTFSST